MRDASSPRNGILAVALTALLAAPAARTDSSRGGDTRLNYVLNCQGCHLSDGSGMPGRVPNLKDFAGYFLRVAGGREFLVRVPGAAGSSLSDAELADVMNWILGNFSSGQLPRDFQPYSAAEVAVLRKQPLLEVAGERARLVQRMQNTPGVLPAGPRLRTDPGSGP